MSRIDEMIYHLEAMAKCFNHNIGTQQQKVDGKDRFACIMCGHCPEAEAEWLRAIKAEVTGEPPASKRASPKKLREPME